MLLSVGPCTIDTATREVRRAGERLAVEPKVFDLLMLLIENRTRVVSRNEIVDKVWAGRAVSDASLSTCVKALRKALDDSGKTQRMVRTVHRRGFRWVGPLVESSRISPNDTPVHPVVQPAGELSIAVLPLEVSGGTDGAAVVADGFVQDIITGLGQTRCLFVIGRGTTFALKSRDPAEIARTIGVRYVLSGHLRQDGKRIRLNMCLADTTGPFEVWAKSFDRRVEDIFVLQSEIASLVVSRVHVTIEDAQRRRALSKPVASLDAWSAYYRACWHLDRHTVSDYDRAEEFLRLAARLDPGAARVLAGLSFVYRQRAFLDLGADREAHIARAIDFAQSCLSLDPLDPQGHWAFGRALMLRNEVGAALEAFEVATSLNPSFAIGQYSVGFARSMIGSTASSDECIENAQRLSPLDPMRFAMLATHAFNSATTGQYAKAARLGGLAAAHPNAHLHIVAIASMCSALAGDNTVAAKHARRLRESRPSYRVADFFRAFPFQTAAHVSTFRRGFALVGIPA